jgi:phosphomannomutase/phosphoglucomutase
MPVRSLNADAHGPGLLEGNGSVRSKPWSETYLADLCARFTFRRRFRIVVDCGNGVMGPTALAAFARCGVDVVPLYCDPDGDFPNHLPDPGGTRST